MKSMTRPSVAKKMMNQSFHGVARQAVLDPDDDLGL